MSDTQKTLTPAMQHMTEISHGLRQCRAEVDRVMPTCPAELQADLMAASDELSKIIVRQNRLEEKLRSACLKGSK